MIKQKKSSITPFLILIALCLLLTVRAGIGQQSNEDWQTETDTNDSDRQVNRADDTQWNMEHDKQNLLQSQAQLEKAYDALQNTDRELTRDMNDLAAKQHDVALELNAVLSSLNDVHRRLGEF